MKKGKRGKEKEACEREDEKRREIKMNVSKGSKIKRRPPKPKLYIDFNS